MSLSLNLLLGSNNSSGRVSYGWRVVLGTTSNDSSYIAFWWWCGKGENDGKGKGKAREKELIRYSWRVKQGVQKQNPPSHELLQDSNSKPPPKTDNVTIPHSSTLTLENLNFDQPIALRKEVRSCAQHPMSILFHIIHYHHPFVGSPLHCPPLSEAMNQPQWSYGRRDESIEKKQNKGDGWSS